jgi:SARP family transcriptional regulator, regulator of embCAB operon
VIILGMLGPTTLHYHEYEVSLRPTHAVLSLIFASEPGNAVASHEIQRLTWPDRPPCDATAANLRSTIRMLRRSFAAAFGFPAPPEGGAFPPARAIVAGHPGYRMPISATDADTFSQLATDARLSLEAGRPEAAWAQASGALKLWRGKPLADAGARSFAVGLAARLNDLHVAVRITRAEAEIWRGTHREIVGDLCDLVADYPGNFDAWCFLVNALARAGRIEEAADACQRAVRYAHARGIDDLRHKRLQYDLLNGNLPMTGPPWPAAAVPDGRYTRVRPPRQDLVAAPAADDAG